MGKRHRVFLSRQAVEILRQVHQLTGHGAHVFPSISRGSVPMGDVTLNHFFKRIDFGVSDFSPHGTRGTAATLLRELGFGRDVVELPLAHNEKNATVAAYSPMGLTADRKRASWPLTPRPSSRRFIRLNGPTVSTASCRSRSCHPASNTDCADQALSTDSQARCASLSAASAVSSALASACRLSGSGIGNGAWSSSSSTDRAVASVWA
jgi:hypothetical protein